MRMWLKYLIAIAVGCISVLVFPSTSAQNEHVLNFLVELVLRFGRYTLLPVLFFSVCIAFFKLRDQKQLLKVGLWTFGIIIVSTLGLVILGLVSALIIPLPRIPISLEKVVDTPAFNWQTLLTKVFPYSGFDALREGAYLLPAFVFAGFAGAGCVSDKNNTKVAVTWFESMSHVCYIVMSFFTEILTFGMIFVMARWTMDFVFVVKSGVYNYLILMLACILVLIGGVIYPLILKFLCHDPHPYRTLYASICPFITAFFSGDTNLALVLNIRHGKESLGIKKRVNSVTYPLFSIFARGGSALVQTICFVLILRSYSNLGISFSDAMWIGGISFALSFVLGEIPKGGPFFAITIMCILYERGFESGYLLLKNASPILCSFAAGIDCLTAMFGSYIVAVKTQTIQHQEIKKFI